MQGAIAALERLLESGVSSSERAMRLRALIDSLKRDLEKAKLLAQGQVTIECNRLHLT